MVVCTACGAAFADRIPEQADFDRYYRELSKYEGGDPPGRALPPLRSASKISPQCCASTSPAPTRGHSRSAAVMDNCYGRCGSRDSRELTGADPSPGCADAALRFYGIPVMTSTVFTVPPLEQPFEFLILTGVMEHIRDLDSTVERFHELLAPSGRVYLEVPDASRLEPAMDAPFQEFSVEHIELFLAHLLE